MRAEAGLACARVLPFMCAVDPQSRFAIVSRIANTRPAPPLRIILMCHRGAEDHHTHPR